MKFSPLDIYNKEFKKSAFGYNTQEVDDFLDDIGVAYEKLLKHVNTLQDENKRLQERLQNYENIEDKLTETLESVQETARQQSQQAQKEAEMIIEEAKSKAEKIKNEAHREVEEEYKKLQRLKDLHQLFEIRFKSLIENHWKLMEDSDLKEDLEDKIEDAENNLDEG